MAISERTPSNQSATIALAIGGTVVIFLYAALAATQILVLNPLAAVPGIRLEQIWVDIDAFTGTSSSVVLTLVPLGLGVGLAIILLVLLILARGATPLAAAFAYLGMLTLGAPAVFMASFPVGMDLADTYLIGGAPYALWTYLLYAVSGAAMVGALALAIVVVARQRVTAAVAA
jgi:hypothetical protein